MSRLTIETSSPNAEAVYNLFKQASEPMTIKEAANQLGLTSPKVLGLMTSWRKKGLLENAEPQIVDGKELQTFQWTGLEADIVAKAAQTSTANDPNVLTEKGAAVLKVLQENDEVLTASEIAEILGTTPIACNGSANSLVKKGLIERVEIVLELPDGSTKSAKGIQLTDAGRAYSL